MEYNVCRFRCGSIFKAHKNSCKMCFDKFSLDPNKIDEGFGGMTMLYILCKFPLKNKEKIKLLILRGAKIYFGFYSNNPIFRFIENYVDEAEDILLSWLDNPYSNLYLPPVVDILEKLRLAGRKLHIGLCINDRYETILNIALGRSYLNINLIKILLDNVPLLFELENKNNRDETPLIHLIFHLDNTNDNSIKCIEMLLDKGANINAKDKDGNTPLHHAIFKCSFELVKLLLNRGANKHIKNEENKSPLEYAFDNMKKCEIEYIINYEFIYDMIKEPDC